MSRVATSRFLRAISLCLALSACGGEDGSSDDTDDSNEEKDAGNNRRDSSRPDGGTSKDDAKVPDSGGGKNDAGSGDPRLDALAGRYLMRWDVLGTASSTHPLTNGPLKIRSRLSTLVLAELSVDGDKLVSRERVCTQIAEQACKEGCTKATTSIDNRTIAILVTKNQAREWTLDGDTLKAGPSIAQLGYDDEDLEVAAPTSNTDDRVWDVDTSTPAREGFLTRVSVTLEGIPLAVTCNAFGTQKYASAFTATVGEDGSFTYPEQNLDLDGSEAPALGSDNETCDMQASMADTPIDNQTARLVRYGDDLSEDAFWTCPKASVFDTELPPTEPGLDGP